MLDNQNSKAALNKLLIISILFLMTMFLYSYLYERDKINFTKQNYKGLVIKKYYRELRYPTIVVKNINSLDTFSIDITLHDSLYYFLEIGDTLLKVRGRQAIYKMEDGILKEYPAFF